MRRVASPNIRSVLLAFCCALSLCAQAQQRPYIGFAYPAGAQQGTSVQIRVGGQALDGVDGVTVTGKGVSARITDYYRRLNNQEMQLLNEQLRMLRRQTLSDSVRAELIKSEQPEMTSDDPAMMSSAQADEEKVIPKSRKESAREQVLKIEKRTMEYVAQPACDSIASLVLIEITIAPDAEPGPRELRLVTLRGVSNPLGFHVGQVPEVTRPPMQTAIKQVLGKESQSLRKRSPGDNEQRITLPCTVNGQIASGEVNLFRFEATKGQHLVITTLGRQLVPFIADAVPGWFQPVLTLYNAGGREVAYSDDYRFKPDPTLLYEVPEDGEYAFEIRDSLYRGREDFVYRVTIGELPFITSIFPLGGKAGTACSPAIKGWNLEDAKLASVATGAKPGIHSLAATQKDFVSNRVPFAMDDLPDAFDQEPNDSPATAQLATLPLIINGRIDKPGDWDVFQFAGKSGDEVVLEVQARRLDSPLDSFVKLTDSAGNVLAFNDDREDLSAGINTHQADSYVSAKLPANGSYFVHIGDTARQGGEEYGYRLRLSAPQPDFELRVVPSSISLRSRSTAALTVYAQRKDGFDGPIRLALKDPPEGISAAPVFMAGTQAVARLNIRAQKATTQEPVTLQVIGTAKPEGEEIVHEAVPAEDRMQAFLWRHLVPAEDLRALVFDPSFRPRPRRVAQALPVTKPVTAPAPSTVTTNTPGSATNAAPAKPRFTRQQVAARLRQLQRLFEEDMLTDDFYAQKVAECEAAE